MAILQPYDRKRCDRLRSITAPPRFGGSGFLGILNLAGSGSTPFGYLYDDRRT